jgi:CRP-like cAMP-binding protein
MTNLEAYLAQHEFLKGLDQKYLQVLAGCASNVRFDEGQYVYRIGQEAHNFYLIKEGSVALELYTPQKGSIRIKTVGEGEVMGFSWLLPPYHWHFDARVLELTRAYALDAKCLRAKCEKDPRLGYEITERFAHIIQEALNSTCMQLLDIYKST